MAVLVTRPQPDADATAAVLREKGFAAQVAPMLRFEALPFQDDIDMRYGAIILTSSNALRGIQSHLANSKRLKNWLKLPVFAVGEHTSAAAGEAGFAKVISAKGDAAGLRDSVLASVKAKDIKKTATLLYLAGADLARDLAGELGQRGFTVVTHTTYRMAQVSELPRETCEAFAANRIEAVLHYSRRSARAFLDAARAAGVEISALAVPQCCISDAVALILRDAGATQVLTARSPDENALLEALMRALRP
jgi:uroporphyrinogen-III synthase